jgi:hypothetical protein
MNTTLFEQFIPTICALTDEDLHQTHKLDTKLLLARDGDIDVCYVPFEYINSQARVVIVGITPGRTQLVNAILEARRQLEMGSSYKDVLIASKKTGAFSGAMRPNLINLLDSVGVNRLLEIKSCESLFGESSHLVHTTSVLRNAVFIKSNNYSGTPNMIKNSFLRSQLETYFGEDAKALPNAIYVPLGDKVAEALHYLAGKGWISSSNILDGLPHPSGANAERIAYFLGKKNKDALSIKTDPDKLDRSKERMIEMVRALS